MKYIKTYENISVKIQGSQGSEGYIYEKDETGLNTGHRIFISNDEFQILYSDGLIKNNNNIAKGYSYYSEIISDNGYPIFYTTFKDRKIIQDKLELMRAAEKYNM